MIVRMVAYYLLRMVEIDNMFHFPEFHRHRDSTILCFLNNH
jgi:hypothetical protein